MDMYDGIERVLADRKAKRMRFAYGGDVRAGDSVGGLRGDTGGYSGRSSAGGYSGPVSRSGMEATQRNVEAARASQAGGSPGERESAQVEQRKLQREATKAAQDVAIETAIRKQAQVEYRPTPSSVYGRGTAAKGVEQARVDAEKAAARELYNRTVAQKIMGVEVGGQSDILRAKAKTSSAAGPAQFTKDTWLKTVEKYRPDILRTYDRKTVLNMRTENPQLVESLLTQTVGEYANTLTRNRIAPTEGNMYLMHFLGEGDAIKVLKGTPTESVESLVQPRAVTANKNLLENKSVADVTGWANRKMASVEPISVAGLEVPAAQGFSPIGSISSEVNKILGIRPATQSGILSSRMAQATPTTATDATEETTSPAVTTTGQTTVTPQSGFDWAKGSWSFDKEDPSRKQSLYTQPNPFLGADAPNSVTGDTPESYAETMRIPVDQVKSRISTINGVPQVEFYQKEIYDIPGEMVSNLFSGIGGLFKPAEKKYLGAESDRASSNQTATNTGYGPYGDLTAEQYRQQYGGRSEANTGVASVLPIVQPAAEVASAQPAPAGITQTAAAAPFAYTGRVTTVPTTYAENVYALPRVGTSSIEDSLSLLNKRPFYAGYQTV